MPVPLMEFVAPVAHLLLFALGQYDANGTADGLWLEADTLLRKAEENLLSAKRDTERIEQARLMYHPDVVSMAELEQRYDIRRRELNVHKHDINNASRSERWMAWSALTKALRNDLQLIRDLDKDVTATTTCPDRPARPVPSAEHEYEMPHLESRPRKSKRTRLREALVTRLSKSKEVAQALGKAEAEAEVNAGNELSVNGQAGRLDSEILVAISELTGQDFGQQVAEALKSSLFSSSSTTLVSSSDELHDEPLLRLKGTPSFESFYCNARVSLAFSESQ